MDEYMGIVKLFAGNYAPQNWMVCDGSTLSISANSALFSLLGTQYGGDGVTNFRLPDLRSRVPIGAGQAPGLSNYTIGEKTGQEEVRMTRDNLPANIPASLNVNNANADTSTPVGGNSIATPGFIGSSRDFTPTLGFNAQAPNVSLSPQSVTVNPAGGSIPIPTIPPCLGMMYIICVAGVYPPRP